MSQSQSDPASSNSTDPQQSSQSSSTTGPAPYPSATDEADTDSTDKHSSGSVPMSRRRFMRSTAAAGVCVPASTSINGGGDGGWGAPEWLRGLWNEDDDEGDLPSVMTMEDLPTHAPSDRPGNFDKPGYMSRDAYRMMAETERQMEAKAPKPNLTKVDATQELGISPGDTITSALNSADLEGKMLNFPEGEYFISQPPVTPKKSAVVLSANNFGIKGPKATFVLKPGVQIRFQIIAGQRAICGPFTIDQSAKGAMCSTLLKTSGRIDYTNVTKVGSVAQSALKGIAGNEIMILPNPQNGGYIRVTGWTCMGGSNAGSHSWATTRCPPPPGFVQGVNGGNGCPGMGVYDGSNGTVDFVGCKLRGWENGVYASKTEGTAVRVLGGGYVNNNNGSVRVGGGDSVVDGCSVLLDQRIYDVQDMPGPYKPGGIQGLNCIRSETKGGEYANPVDSKTSELKNLDLRAIKIKDNPVSCAGGVNGLIRVQGTSAAGPIDNCRIENHIPGTPMIKANRPGHGNYPQPPGPYNLSISNVDIYGRPEGEPAVKLMGRPNSSIKDSCIHLAGAGPEQIQGIPSGSITNVGYGKNCAKSQGTDGPVGSFNQSQLANYSAGNYSYQDFARGRSGGPGIIQQITSAFSSLVITLMMVLLVVITAIVGLLLVAGLGMYKLVRQ